MLAFIAAIVAIGLFAEGGTVVSGKTIVKVSHEQLFYNRINKAIDYSLDIRVLIVPSQHLSKFVRY